MKVPQHFLFLGLVSALLLNAGNSLAWQTKPVVNKNPKPAVKNNQPASGKKYSFHEASTLSGITLQPDRKSGNILLHFDQQLMEPGTLLVKNNAGKVMYTNLLQPEKERVTHTMNIGRLTPGLYSIEVKTAETTFWKKVRVRN